MMSGCALQYSVTQSRFIRVLRVRSVVKLPPVATTEAQQLAAALVALGCPPEKSATMAAQLDKRARQLANEKGRPYEEALAHLLNLMRQGWAAPKN